MPYCADQILTLATQIYQDIGSPTSQSIGWVSGWITASGGMIAGLNSRLGSCVSLSGDSPCLVNFDGPESVIAETIYQSNYYNKQALCVLAGGISDVPWTQLKEGDSTVTRESRTSFAKEYRALYQEAEDKLKILIHYWTLDHTGPQGINAAQVYSFPSP